jgi:transposase
MTNRLCVGIDVSKCENIVSIVDRSSVIEEFGVPNNLPGSKTISSRITAAMQKNSYDSLAIGLEAASVYGETLAHTLKDSCSAPGVSPQLFILNPRQVKGFKDSYPELQKNDKIDAGLIANYLLAGPMLNLRLREAYMDDKYIALQKLTRARFHVARDLSREKNRFLESVFVKFSSLTQEKTFSNTFGKASAAVITGLSVDEIAYMDFEELARFINRKGKNRFPDVEKVARAVQKASRDSYRLPKVIHDSVDQVPAVSLNIIRSFGDQIATLDKYIERRIALVPQPLLSIKGVGPVYSAGIIAEIGDIHRFKDHAALAKYAGLCWTRHQSGGFQAEHTRMIKSGNRYLKYYLIQATNRVRVCDPGFRRFYQLKYRQSAHHKHKRALAPTAGKFVRSAYALLRDNRLYIPPEEI